MPQCCVPLCLNRSETKITTKVSFYRFPCNDKEKRKWLQLIRRDNFTPNCNSRVCSWHFPHGKAAGPFRFAWNEGKSFPVHLSQSPKASKHHLSQSPKASKHHLSQSPKASKQNKHPVPLPTCGEDEDTDELEVHNADIVTAETPSTSTETPSTSTESPSTSTETPSTSTETPSTSTETPSTSTESPSTSTETPSTSTETPSTSTETPSTSTETPSTSTETPSTSTETPSTSTETPSTSTETPGPRNSLVVLEIEIDMLRRENEKLKKQLEKQKQTFSFGQISSHSDRVQYYTGLPDAATVLLLEELLSKCELQYHSNWTVQCVPLVDQLLLTLMKLKLNCGHIDLATRFNCSTATVTNVFLTIVSALYDILYVNMPKNKTLSTAKSQTSLTDCSETETEKLVDTLSVQRLKHFSILDHIPHQFRKNFDKILKVCVCLTNLQTHFLREIA